MEVTAVPPVTPATGTTNGGAAVATPAPNEPAKPQYVTLEQYQALEKQVAYAAKTARETADKFAAPPAAKSEGDKTLTEQMAEIQAERALMRKEKKLSAIEFALKKHGVSELSAPRFAEVILNEEDAKLEIDGRNVTYKEAEGKKSPVVDWMQAYLSSDKGAAFKPLKATAASEGLNKVSNGAVNVTGWRPANLKEAMADPTKWWALKQSDPEYAKSLK